MENKTVFIHFNLMNMYMYFKSVSWSQVWVYINFYTNWNKYIHIEFKISIYTQ